MVDINTLLKSFDKKKTFDGLTIPFASYKKEFRMTFAVDASLYAVILGSTVRPSSESLQHAWDIENQSGLTAIYRTIASDMIRDQHIKDDSTAASAWKSLTAEYEKDTRSNRFAFKSKFYNPVHDPSKPVDVYVAAIVAAAERLTSIGHAPKPIETTDTIIMHLHSSFHECRANLTMRDKDPSLVELHNLLIEWEKQQNLLTGGSFAVKAEPSEETALTARSRPSRSSHPRARSISDSEHETCDWGNTQNRKGACSRCGIPGHTANRCIISMPQSVKDKILGRHQTSRTRAERRAAEEAHHAFGKRAFETDMSDSEDDAAAALSTRRYKAHAGFASHSSSSSVSLEDHEKITYFA